MIKVVAALIEKDNKYLIAKRSTGDIHLLGKWEFPGGKVEKGESETKAIEREIYEEFELSVEALEFVINNLYDYSDKTVDLRLYKCRFIKGNFRLHAHSEYKLVNANELSRYDFAPADELLVEHVRMMHYER